MGAIGLINNILTVYVSFRLLGVWIFGAEFTKNLGFLVALMLTLSSVFLLQRIGVIPSSK